MYRSLLVHLDEDRHCAARADVAQRLARRFGAHLVGLAPSGRAPVSLSFAATALLAEAAQAVRADAQRRADDFVAACHAAGLMSVEALADPEDPVVSLVDHAHCSDLVPEAARALSDSLPMLCKAREVTVLRCDAPGGSVDELGAAIQGKLEALRRWLMWHGVDAQLRLEVSGLDAGELLLSRAADLGADLLVMGAWGRARWTQRWLGGATRTLLSSMTLPVLMSH